MDIALAGEAIDDALGFGGRVMWRSWVVGLLIALAAWPAGAKDRDYMGADAGYLVYSVGTSKIGMHFNFPYRQFAAAGRSEWKGKIAPSLGGAIYLKVKNPDFSGDESGHVVVRRLPPGRYEVHNFSFGGSNLAGTSYNFSAAKPFSLPFEVRSGEATYIGSFMRAPSLGTPLQAALGAKGYFVVADRSARDLPIAAQRLPAGVRVAGEVTDVTQFGSAILRTGHP